jgi:hypothetical protein
VFIYAHWVITLTMNTFVTEGEALRTVGDWLLGMRVLWCVKHELQNKHPTSRLRSMIINLPTFDTSASVKKTETNWSLIFTKFWVFSQIFSYLMEVQYIRVEKKGGTPFSWNIFARYLLMWVHCF